MKIIRHTLVRLALVLAVAPATGCTFGVLPRDARDPALAAVPPCVSGDVCGIDFAWAAVALQSAQH